MASDGWTDVFRTHPIAPRRPNGFRPAGQAGIAACVFGPDVLRATARSDECQCYGDTCAATSLNKNIHIALSRRIKNTR
ncbi:hypothetical protein BLAT2472_30622 [Burkholderia latens]